ncbi:GGDEF domain-containing protein [Sulfurimonas sp. C5]|uniref:GGDEF domain-containing protein n=1 Tax=Sulfurimonas sp. C5 TaxID=3036947 RepID=UPI002455A855|nr:GGDEF domain-containing protein [Sulfurimonas sp. C5]MDH4944939.1 GGDEF domain-containing protein [Sulfurimonas sp. C5]
MKRFTELKQLVPFIDNAFESFYETMLHDRRLAIFFESDEQIQMLIQKQKVHFVSSLGLDIESIKDVYIKMGEFHYDRLIPYIDFIKGTDILEEHFLLNSQQCQNTQKLMDEIFEYFKIMKAFTAKGYLNRMLSEDKKDIENFFEHIVLDQTHSLPRAIILQKIKWLKELLNCIENNGDFEEENAKRFLIEEWLEELNFLTTEKRVFFEELEKRILLNTQNLFYFLKREEYLEILPLYTSLLNIYKLTLMMNNAVTIEFANKVIEDMKIDTLTQLFRKDLFEEILQKEIALIQRNHDYTMSVVYIDLDNFKHVNDNFGHYSGDKVIEKVGEIIKTNIRLSDFGFRIGGDEFAVILKDATKEQAKMVSEKIKVGFTSYQFVFNDEVTFSVGMSIGVEEVRYKENLEMKTILENVDWKLYEAKKRGKNQICL